MGRKKGKQGGQFGYKSKHAAAQSEINQTISEYRYNSSYQRKQHGSSDSNGIHGRNRPATRPRISTNIFRGLIRERIIEDRLRDATYRRALMTASTQVRVVEEEGAKITKENDALMEPGWLIDYKHQEAMAGIVSSSLSSQTQSRKKQEMSVCSLEILSMRALAVVLNEYISAYGKEDVRDRISVQPGVNIYSLSVLCENVTDDTAYVLGGHPHIDKLVLNASPGDLYQSDDVDADDDNDLYGTGSRLTTKGLLRMAMSRAQSSGLLEEDRKVEQRTVVDSWEDVHLEDEELNGWRMQDKSCIDLKRMELRNFNAESSVEFVTFLRHCSMLTHLSLCKSLNSITGPQILLWNNKNNGDSSFGGSMYVDGSTKTILDILPRLKVLDLSGCKWLHLDLFKLFLQRIMLHSIHKNEYHCQMKTSVALEMVCIGSCDEDLNLHCEAFNKLTNRRPLVCIRPP